MRLNQQDLLPEEKMGHLFPTFRDWSLVEEIQTTGLPFEEIQTTGLPFDEYCKVCGSALSVPYYAANEEGGGEKSRPVFVHKVCIDLPMETEHHLLHPGHQLLLKTREISDGETPYGLVCNSCNEDHFLWSHDYIYKCSDCKEFLLCIICALKLFPTNHKCHPQHPLIPNHTMEEFYCDACSMVHKYAISYECTTCPSFRVNQYCVSPRIVKLLSHRHDVRLVYSIPETQFGEPIYCQICRQHLKGRSVAYHCARCRYYFHIHSCRSIQHFNALRGSPLFLVEEEGADALSESETCDGCRLKISVPYYASTLRGRTVVLMHKFCAELPQRVQHRLHPGHELTLTCSGSQKKETRLLFLSACNACQKPWEGFIYKCPHGSCSFNLDIICALKNVHSQHKFHKHPLTASHTKGLFACSVCNKDSDGPSYQCTTCRYWVHHQCGSVPMSRKHEMHPHLLKLTYSIHDSAPEDHRFFYCQVCREEMQPDDWAYHCSGCKYYIHAHDCSEPPWTREIDEFDYEAALAAAVRLPAVDSKSVTLATLFFMDTNTAGKPLFFDPDETCNRCAKLIAPPCNNCALCNYFLPKSLSEFNDPESLLRGYNSMLEASPNQTNCDGFAMSFPEVVLLWMKISSSVLPRYIKHEGHPHVLLTTFIAEETWCSACERDFVGYAFRCKICNFTIDTYCALLPGSIRHSYDKKHLFKLTYYSIEGVEEYVCEVCEGDITTMWFYHCAECDHSIHPTCIWRYVIDFGPTIRFGRFSNHVLLVPTTNTHPMKCAVCYQEETTGCRYSLLQFWSNRMYHLECLDDSKISEIERWPEEREELVSKLAGLRSEEG